MAAAQQLFGKSWNSPTSFTIKLDSSCTSSSLCNRYAFFSFHTTPPKRWRFAASSSSSSSSTRVPNAKQGWTRSVQLDCPWSRSKPSAMSGKPSLSFKSLFGKRSLRRRIFFASKKVRSIILLNVITLVYASSIPVVKEVEAIVDPASFTVVRFALSALPFIPFVWRAQNDVHTRNAGIELGFWVSLGYLMQALGLLTSDAGRATFLSMLTVIVVPLLDGMLGAVIPARTWFGALMAVLGVAMLESSGSPPCVGDLLNFLSALFFGVHMLRTEHIARNTSKDKFLPLLGYEVCVIAVFSTLWYLVGGSSGGLQECDPSLWTWEKFWDWVVAFPWIPAIYTGIFSSGLCLWGEMAAMCDVSATETAIIYTLEPVWGGGFAWFLLEERWSAAGWVGAALVLVGSLTVQICGSSPDESCEDENSGAKLEHVQVSNDEKGFSSPIVISSSPRKDISDLLK